MPEPLTVSREAIDDFIDRHRLPARFEKTIEEHYLPLAAWVLESRPAGGALLLGINGAQGTGKSTLADFLALALASACEWRVAVLSIDDFYLTRAERAALAKDVHPLLATRGVPGTHDVAMLERSLDGLRQLAVGKTLAIPRFDKARDDRAAASGWPIVTGPVDLIVLEGWCVGSRPQPSEALTRPVNALERDADASGDWRRYVNEQLEHAYAGVFAELDRLVFLKAPDFEAVYRWRLEQEQKLARQADGDRIMSAAQIRDFIQHYERITTANLAELPAIADVLIELDEHHDCVRSTYRR